MRRRHSIVREIDNVRPLRDMACDAPSEMIVDIVFEVDLLLMGQTIEIFLRPIRRAVVDRNQLDVPTGKIRMTEQALDCTARKLHLVVRGNNDGDAVLKVHAPRTPPRRLKCRKHLCETLRTRRLVAQDIVLEIELIAEIRKERLHLERK